MLACWCLPWGSSSVLSHSSQKIKRISALIGRATLNFQKCKISNKLDWTWTEPKLTTFSRLVSLLISQLLRQMLASTYTMVDMRFRLVGVDLGPCSGFECGAAVSSSSTFFYLFLVRLAAGRARQTTVWGLNHVIFGVVSALRAG